jgi:hypothetical protein
MLRWTMNKKRRYAAAIRMGTAANQSQRDIDAV